MDWWGVVLLMLGTTIIWHWGVNKNLLKREGFTTGNSPNETLEKLRSVNGNLVSSVNMSVHRDNYEEIVVELETWVNNSMAGILSDGSFDAGTDTTETVKTFNDLAQFKKNLNEFVDVIDKM